MVAVNAVDQISFQILYYRGTDCNMDQRSPQKPKIKQHISIYIFTMVNNNHLCCGGRGDDVALEREQWLKVP